MPRRTKTQNRRMLKSIQLKSFEMFGCGLLSMKEYDYIMKATTKALNKL
tara:strand:- start:485 stop:631 length:147 start_codon:yes stop_codon:yes gene_type:complete